MQIPSVVIVGRPNVGKSSLFNAIYGSRVAIVEETPGVTRDRVSRIVERDGAVFELVDTGGMGLQDEEELAEHIQMQIEIAIERADLALLVVDGKAGVQPLDSQIANRLRQAEKQVLVVVNKCDRRADLPSAADFYELGFPEVQTTSAAHRRGVRDLTRRVVSLLPEMTAEPPETPEEAEPMKLALVGRRNVGKSTLINYLAQEPRVVVSETPGTTRDSVDVRFRMGDLRFVAIDTAGLRRRKQVKGAVDFYSMERSRQSIRRADVVALMIEAPMEVGRLDKQLAGYVTDEYKPCVIAVNKIDLAGGIPHEEFHEYIRDRLAGFSYAPIVCISALTGENVAQLIATAAALHEQSFVEVPDEELAEVVEEAVARNHPPARGRRYTRIHSARQVAVQPPTIVFRSNRPDEIPASYRRYLANELRSAFGFSAIPLRLFFRTPEDSNQNE